MLREILIFFFLNYLVVGVCEREEDCKVQEEHGLKSINMEQKRTNLVNDVILTTVLQRV